MVTLTKKIETKVCFLEVSLRLFIIDCEARESGILHKIKEEDEEEEEEKKEFANSNKNRKDSSIGERIPNFEVLNNNKDSRGKY